MMDDENFGVSPLGFDQYDDDASSDNEDDDMIEVEVPKKKGRGANFTPAEDENVVKAWQAVSLDPITGDEQAGATYWRRIYEHFCQINKSGIHRSQISVSHRWQAISTSSTRWAACLEQVERLNPSGANAQDKVNIAQRLYKGKPKKKGGKAGKAFCLHHCWDFLEHDEKWRTRNNDVPTKSKKSSNSCSPIDDNGVDVETGDESDGARSPTPSSAPSKKRPPGRKGETDELKKLGLETAYKESLDNMVTTRSLLPIEKSLRMQDGWR